jgi:molybdenum-dependent DNA-binding transcriptional regulator ModE
MPSEPDPETRLTVSEPDLAQSEMDPTLASTHLGCEVVPNPEADPIARDTVTDDDVLLLFPDEPEAAALEPDSLAGFAPPPRPQAGRDLSPENHIVLKQLVSRTSGVKKRLDELDESAVQLLSEYQTLERELREAAAKLEGELRDTTEKVTGEYRRIENVSHEAAARLAAEYSKVEESAREAERRSVTAVATIEQLQKSIIELHVLQDLAKAEERLTILNARANQLDERLARKAKERAATIDSLLRVVLASVTAVTTAMAGLKSFAKRSLTDLTDGMQRAFAFATTSTQKQEPQPGQSRMSRQWAEVSTTVFKTGRSMLPAKRRAVLVGLGVIALLVFIVSRSLGTTDGESARLPASRLPELLLARAPELPFTVLPSRTSGSFVQSTAKSVAPPSKSVVPSSKSATTPSKSVAAPSKPVVAPARPAASAAIVPTSGSSGASAKTTRDARQPKPQAPSSQFVGTLAVESSPPGAAVFINRQRVGVTPLEVQGLASGSRVIWIERDGYMRWTAAVDVSADRLTRVNAKLQADTAP